jgi:nitrate reductase gamma subunit
MARLLYISGMVFFAVLIGDTTHRLQQLYNAGTLFEQYNSERKSAVTLLAVSSCGLATLCVIKVVRLRRRFKHHSFASIEKERVPVVDGKESTSIYTAPDAVDKWQERQLRIRKPHRRQSLEINGLWMGMLRVYCGVLPVLYSYTLVNYLFLWLPRGAGTLVLSILFPVLLLGSVLTSVGILRKKTWGMKFGYAMAIFHLLIFPVGTAAGFVMLIGLMGATSEFTAPRRRRRRVSRKAKRRKLQSAAV